MNGAKKGSMLGFNPWLVAPDSQYELMGMLYHLSLSSYYFVSSLVFVVYLISFLQPMSLEQDGFGCGN